MKKRLLGFMMAGTMAFSSFQISLFAMETELQTEEQIIADSVPATADDALLQSPDGEVESNGMSEGLFETDYDFTVSWYPGEGSISDEYSDDPSVFEDGYYDGENIRPCVELALIAPENKVFKSWSLDGAEVDFESYWVENESGSFYNYTIDRDMAFVAVWEAQTDTAPDMMPDETDMLSSAPEQSLESVETETIINTYQLNENVETETNTPIDADLFVDTEPVPEEVSANDTDLVAEKAYEEASDVSGSVLEAETETEEDSLTWRTIEADTDGGTTLSVEGMLPAGAQASIEDKTAEETIDSINGELLLKLDTALEDDENKPIQPIDNLTVSIMDSAIGEALEEGSEISVWDLSNENAPSRLTGVQTDGNTALFDADTLTEYAIVKTVLKKVLTASDGNNYRVTVSYDTGCGIPADAELLVNEITEGDEEYDDYLSASASALDIPVERLVARLFDIKIVDKNDPTIIYQPDKSVEVSVEQVEISDPRVLHFKEGEEQSTEELEVLSSTDAVSFVTDSFSVFVVAGENGVPSSSEEISISTIPAQTYTGKAVTPIPVVKAGSSTLTRGTDYTVSYRNNVYAGTATIIITGTGSYSGSTTAYFKINPKQIYTTSIGAVSPQTYTGNPIKPVPVVRDGYTVLRNGRDYTVAYSNSTNIGCATATIMGRGNYTGMRVVPFRINPKQIVNVSVGTIPSQTYTGGEIKPIPTVRDGSTVLRSGVDFAVSYRNNTNVGNATLTITGKGNYAGSKISSFRINPKNISGTTVDAIPARTYTGGAITPIPVVRSGGRVLRNGTDYSASYRNNVNAGTATVLITGKGNYTGSKTASFRIDPESISRAMVGAIPTRKYTGRAYNPIPYVTVRNRILRMGTDYNIFYRNNINAGIATIILIGKNNYTGSKTSLFRIEKADQNITVTVSEDTIPLGETAQISVDGAVGSISFSSSNATIATVSNTGLITAKKEGMVAISVTASETENYNRATRTISIIVMVNNEFEQGNVLYQFEDGVMMVVGYTGNYSSYAVSEVVNGKTVTEINDEAFMNNTSITSISLPNTISVIGARAFSGCTNLTQMTTHD